MLQRWNPNVVYHRPSFPIKLRGKTWQEACIISMKKWANLAFGEDLHFLGRCWLWEWPMPHSGTQEYGCWPLQKEPQVIFSGIALQAVLRWGSKRPSNYLSEPPSPSDLSWVIFGLLKHPVKELGLPPPLPPFLYLRILASSLGMTWLYHSTNLSSRSYSQGFYLPHFCYSGCPV